MEGVDAAGVCGGTKAKGDGVRDWLPRYSPFVREVAEAISSCYTVKGDWQLRVRQAEAAIKKLKELGWKEPS